MNIKIIFLLFIAMLSVSTSPIIARYLENVSAVAISFWRMSFGAIILWIISLFRKQTALKNESLNRTLLAGILLGIHFALFFGAIKLTTIANATFLGTLAPFFTLMIELVIFKRHYKKMVYVGLLVSIIGTILVLMNDFDLSTRYTLGNIYAILCSLAISISFLIAEKVRNTEGTIEYTRMLYGVAALTIFIIGSFYTPTFIVTQKTEILGFIFLALIPTILGHNIFYYCVKFTTPTIVGTVPLGEPIIASIIAFFLFNELISLNTTIGGALCIYGIFIILRNRSIASN